MRPNASPRPTSLRNRRDSARSALARRRALTPLVEAIERRQLLAANLGYIQGTVFNDLLNDHALDATDPRLAGATINLVAAPSGPTIATTLTDANGFYSFSNVAPGDYLVQETAPAGFVSTGSQVLSQLNPASATPGSTRSISVKVVDPNSVYATTGGFPTSPSRFEGLAMSINGVDDTAGQVVDTFKVSLGSTSGGTDLNSGYYTYCADNLHSLDFTSDVYKALPSPGSTIAKVLPPGTAKVSPQHAGQIGYLYNHYAIGQLDRTHAAALQVAIWELIYDDSPIDLTTGQFHLLGPIAPYTTATEYSAIVADANAYLTASVGNYEQVGFLDATVGGTVTDTNHRQGVLYTNSLNFGDAPASSISGVVYFDKDASGTKNAGDLPLAGVAVSLTGTDINGAAVSLATTTLADGSYTFGNLVAGTYKVTETQPAGYNQGTDAVGAAGGSAVQTATNDVVSGISLGSGQSATAYNFGELGSSISGTVYLDANLDTVLNAGESGLSGLPVTLKDSGGNVVATTTTGANGSYSFGNVAPGAYTVVETVKTGYGTDTPITLPVTVGSTPVSGVNFGETLGSLSGLVYFDKDASGGYNAGDVVLPGVTVTLTGTDAAGAAVSLTTTTLADGTFGFGSLVAGSYVVTETQPSGYNQGTDAAGSAGGSAVQTATNDVVSGVALGAGQVATTYNFGEVGSTISGTVFLDVNRNTTLDGGDTGLSGLTVTLKDSGGNVVATTTTGANGGYSFGNVAPGTYTVVETVKTGYGTDTPITLPVTLGSTPVSGVNFGETLGSLSGLVYFDKDASGGYNAGDVVLPGVTVTLTGTDAAGAAVSLTTTTLADGTFGFGSLVAGSYVVTETQPSGYNQGTDAAGTAGGSAVQTATNDVVSGVALGSGQSATAYNFGELGSSIAGTVFLDANLDTVLNAGESGLSGLTVTLKDSGGNVVATTTTGANGGYSFGNVAPGTYTVVETVKTGYGTDTPITLPVTLGSTPVSGMNFGETLGSLSGLVYFDKDASGGFNSGDVALGGVTVALTGTDAAGNAVSLSTTTLADGSFSFGSLVAGSYVVTETQPAGYNQGTDAAGTAGGSAVQTATNDVVSGVALGAGQVATTYNFGEVGSAIGGTVYLDANRDTVLNAGESGLSGLTVTLKDSGGNVVATTTTGANGAYSFGNVAPGTYTVVETVKTGYGTDTPVTLPVTVGTAPVTGVNFGETLGSLSGLVYFDKDASGGFNSGDVALGGVTVTLVGTDAAGAAVSLTTTTLADGTFKFNGLVAGTYKVTETQPAGYNQGTDAPGTAGGSAVQTATNDVVSGVALGAGQLSTGYSFGEVGSSIAGTVYLDANRNTTLDGGDTGLSGLTVTLKDAGGNLVATTTTGANGSYSFGNVAPGSYTVVETVKTGYGTDTPITLPVTVGTAPVTGVNFGETLGSAVGVGLLRQERRRDVHDGRRRPPGRHRDPDRHRLGGERGQPDHDDPRGRDVQVQQPRRRCLQGHGDPAGGLQPGDRRGRDRRRVGRPDRGE